MNTNILKRFAQAARIKLLDQIAAKLEKVLHTDSAELREKATQIQQLQEAINQSSKAQVIDTVAYTWFNRLVALRFMDVNGYEPLGIKVVSPAANATLPEILQEAKAGNISQDLPVNHQRIYDVLNGKIPATNAQNEAYKELLVGACNHLHSIFPFLFERINDYSELLLPDDLLSEFSILEDIKKGMTEEDCQEVEILGWLYQFYISEKKDEVFASKAKVKKEDIPAATQLFTPRWIVEYMVQNTVGKLWLQNNPKSKLREHMPYFIESPSVENEDYLKINSVEDITLLDQACGSGHILVYGFELLSKMYEEEGYNESEIPKLIIEKNLYGFEIDQRAAQLAGLALMLKARSYQRRVFKKEIIANILCYKDLNLKVFNFNDYKETFVVNKNSDLLKDILAYGYTIAENIEDVWTEDVIDEDTGVTITMDRSKTKIRKGSVLEKEDYANLIRFGNEKISIYVDEIKDSFRLANIELSYYLYHDLKLMLQATNIGSLIIPKAESSVIENALSRVKNKIQTKDVFLNHKLTQIAKALEQLVALSKKYHCVVDNPPYMGSGNMNKALGDFVKANYPDSKADLMACFMEAGRETLLDRGYLGMINQQSWMYNPTYLNFRNKIIEAWSFDTLLHLGPHTFPEIGGEVVQNAAFTITNQLSNKPTIFVRLIDFDKADEKKSNALNKDYYYSFNISEFKNITGFPFAYWIKSEVLKIISDHKPLSEYGDPKPGLQTSNNDRFLREWFELNQNTIGIGLDRNDALFSDYKWFPHNKGGRSPRKWYGNNTLVINFYKDGYELKQWLENNPNDPSTNHWSRNMRNYSYYFKEGITWSAMSSNSLTGRLNGRGFTFDTSGPTLFVKSNLYYYCSLINSKVFSFFIDFFSQTMNKGTGDFSRVPIIEKNIEEIESITKENISIAKLNWFLSEKSSEFIKNSILYHLTTSIEESYDLYQQYWKNKFFQLHKNEEELNQQFIDIYGLQDELTPDVPLEDITILKEESSIENGQLVFRADEVIKQFVSYAVGCMFGRYSLDKEGLILANQGETLEDYYKKVYGSEKPPSGVFRPDKDNIIPILDNEWFEDDIVGRFYAFLKASFGEDNFQQNLAFVEEALGKDIRKYFLKDFYADHVRRYKKRPIYWQFSSPSGAFNVLIYMHRYTPDSLNQILNGYLKDYREKLNAELDRQAHLKNVGTAREQTLAQKEEDRIHKVLLELQEYERELYKLATERIHIDLDDGVLVNYNKFGELIKKVTGLNDKKAKDKVKKFDWIDTSQIR